MTGGSVQQKTISTTLKLIECLQEYRDSRAIKEGLINLSSIDGLQNITRHKLSDGEQEELFSLCTKIKAEDSR